MALRVGKDFRDYAVPPRHLRGRYGAAASSGQQFVEAALPAVAGRRIRVNQYSASVTQHPDRVSDAEFERRRSLLNRGVKERGLDAVLIFGTFQGWQNVFYFSNHWDLV